MKKIFILIISIFSMVAAYSAPADITKKQRVIVSTDIGGSDPDDNQSMAHLLMYTDCFDIEGIVSTPCAGTGNKEEILRMIDLFEKDYPALSRHVDGLMTPQQLRTITKQGRKGMAPLCGYSSHSEGSDWIIECARRESDRPLWISVWGSLEDVAQALHDAPDIADKIRINWIGGPNKKSSINSYTYIVENFPNLYMIEDNASYRGFISDNSKNDEFNVGFYDKYLKDAGHLGKDYAVYYGGVPKMGDTPSLLYLMNGDPDDPTGESWGGSFDLISRSSHQVFDRPTTRDDIIPIYSITDFHIAGPVRDDIAPDQPCCWIEINNSKWDGYYLGNGDYVVRVSLNNFGTTSYKVGSDISDFPDYTATITVENKWPGTEYPTDYMLGGNWYTDKADPTLFMNNYQGEATVYKWRNDVLLDWAGRLAYLEPVSEVVLSPADGNMGQAVAGYNAVKEFTLTGAHLSPESGFVTVTASSTAEISTDGGTSWCETATIDYAESILKYKFLVRMNVPTVGDHHATLTVIAPGDLKDEISLIASGIELPESVEADVYWRLENDDSFIVNGPVNVVAENFSNMSVQRYASPNSATVWPKETGFKADRKTQRNVITGNAWPGDRDMVDDRYIEFGVSAIEGSVLNIDEISYYVCGSGTSSMCLKVLYSIEDDFSNPVNIFERKGMPGNTMLDGKVSSAITLQGGQRCRLRFYPWMNSAGNSKTICLSDVKFHGTVSSSTGVEKVTTDSSEIVSSEYFNFQGIRLNEKPVGLYIVRNFYSDGSVKCFKRLQ